MFALFNAISSRLFQIGSRVRDDERGQTFVEYSLVLVLVAVAVAVLAAWTNLDTAIGSALQSVANAL
jgi:Flp pilus assembly pilin Flp